MSNLATNGKRQKPKPSQYQKLVEVNERISHVEKRLQMLAFRVGEDLKNHSDRINTTWEYVWAIVEALKVEGKLDFLTTEQIDKFHEIIVARHQEQALEDLKQKLTPGQGVCTKCHKVDGGPNFFLKVEEPNTPHCPNCGTKDSLFLKETEIVETST